MATLKELKEQLRKEKNLLEGQEEEAEIGKERKRLKKEIRDTRFKRKFGTPIKLIKGLGKGTLKVAEKTAEFGEALTESLSTQKTKKKR